METVIDARKDGFFGGNDTSMKDEWKVRADLLQTQGYRMIYERR